MIWFLYGKNPLLIQENIQKILETGKYHEKLEISCESNEIPCLEYFINIVTTPNMFGEKNVALVELDKLSEKEVIKYIETSQKDPSDIDIIFYLKNNLPPKNKVLTILKTLKDVKVIEVTEQKDWSLFNLADALFEKNAKKTYELLRKLDIKGESPIAIHAILSQHLRNIARIKFGAEVKLAPFVQNKIKRQANNFLENDILRLYKYFYETDKKLKSGELRENIATVLTIEEILNNK